MIDFPASPVDGQTFNANGLTFIWRAALPAWQNVPLLPAVQTAAGNIAIPNGTVSLPGLCWSAEPSMGWYRPSASQMNLAVANTPVLSFAATTTGVTALTIGPRAAGGQASVNIISDPISATNQKVLGLGISPTGGYLTSTTFGTNVALTMSYNAASHTFNGAGNFNNGLSVAGAPANFGAGANFAAPVNGLTASMVGLGNVLNARQVQNFQSSRPYMGWDANMVTVQVDSTVFGGNWPINIRGTSAHANSVGASGGAPDRSAAWGYAGGDFNLPCMRLDAGGNIRYLLWQTSNDSSIFALRAAGSPVYMEVTGNIGAYSVTMTPSDIRMKENIRPSEVDAVAALLQFEFIEFDFCRGLTGHSDLGFSAQNLKAINASLVHEVEQPESSPLHDLGTVLSPDTTTILAYVSKALQDALKRIATLETQLSKSK